jgi:lysophospholipase L1-like esterase
LGLNVDTVIRTRPGAALVALFAAVLTACGGDEETKRPERVVAALGDSITAGAPRWDPNPGIRAGIGDELDRRSQYGYWAERALPATNFRNCGVPGERTDEIALRLDDCTRGAGTLIVQGGVNDLAQGVEPAEAAANLRSIVRRGKRRGLEVAIVELLPWNGGDRGADRKIRELNRLIARISVDESVKLIRWYRVLADPARPRRMRAGLHADDAHPSVAGYRLLGESVELP